MIPEPYPNGCGVSGVSPIEWILRFLKFGDRFGGLDKFPAIGSIELKTVKSSGIWIKNGKDSL
ncbi:MAG: hypothetical protein SWY16_16115 [Cyanobacteriota bacterium]|nr:hypothetical protein [Cyanobacteriota bacterium]